MPARILLIEDNPENLDLMSYLLTAFGHTALKAVNGEEGLALALREKPDLILCDLQLPKLDGYELARQIRRNPEVSHLALVAVTAYAMRGDRDRVMASGFNGYITKPIIPEEFVSRAEEFLSEKLRSVARPLANAQPQRQPATRPSTTRGKILAVDDLAVNLNLIRSTLEPLGYRVTAVDTVEEALTVGRQDPPDLILSDVHLPEAGGYDFLRLVRKDPELKAIPFVLMSSSVLDTTSAADALALGATRVIFRPLEPEMLIQLVEAFLGERGQG
jgi:two-component system, cell cycle response regulator